MNTRHLLPISSAAAILFATFAYAGSKKTDTAEASPAVTVVSAPAKTAKDTRKEERKEERKQAREAEAAARAAAAATPKLVLKKLAPLNLSDMRLWNWKGVWHASEWDHEFSTIPWRYNHIKQASNGDTSFVLDKTGAPELQGQGGTPAQSRGLWETDVTLPKLRDGMVVAPLWLYDQTSRDEIDFELAGRKGLDVSMHTYLNGKHQQVTTRLFAGTDLSGRRMRFAIKMDQALGYVEMYVDGTRVHRWDRSKMSSFVAKPLKPVIEMWGSNPKNSGFVAWLGSWTGFAKNEAPSVMVVHGYGYTPLP
jgi:hypothetical protein